MIYPESMPTVRHKETGSILFLRLGTLIKSICIASFLALAASVPAQAVTADALIKADPVWQNVTDNRLLLAQLQHSKEEVLKKGSYRLVLKSSLFNLSRNDISASAVKVIAKLNNAGFQAYIVGGCIRDFIMGKKIHDIDITTDATPYEISQIFKNAEITGSGKRFTLAHVPMDGKTIDLATFRKVPERIPNDDRLRVDANGMIITDNYFTRSLEDDANCRDLSINAIFFDLNREELIDYHAGLYDLLIGHTIEVIRKPELTFTQQPGRLLRAIRFAARLNFKLSADAVKAISTTRHNITNLSPKVLGSETLKYFKDGNNLLSYQLLKKYGILELLFPASKGYLNNSGINNFIEDAFRAGDERHAAGDADDPAAAIAVILWPQYQTECNKLDIRNSSPAQQLKLFQKTARKILDRQSKVTLLPEKISAKAEEILTAQSRLSDIESKQNIKAVVAADNFKSAFELLKNRAQFDKNLAPYVSIYQPYYNNLQLKRQ